MGRSAETLRTTTALLAALFLAAACGGGGNSTPAPGSPGPVEPGPGNPPPPAVPQARLDRVAGCDELTEALRADAAFKIGVQAETLRAQGWLVEDFSEGGLPPVPAPANPGGPELGAEDGPTDFTETNVQVAGVDEADIIETDGSRIYVLHGDALVVVDSWPPDDTSLASNTSIEGFPHAMFVADGRAVVFSMVYDDEERFGGEGACGFIGSPLPLVDEALIGDVAPCLPAFTKVTVLDVTAAPTVVRELYLEGSYTAARRHGAIVRVVVQGGNGVPADVPDFWNRIYSGELPATPEEFQAEIDAWEQAATAAIAASALADWLPSQWESRNGSLAEIPPACGAVHLPAVGTSEHGMTRILALDMREDDGEVYDALVLGGASDVYASLDRFVLAQREWSAANDGDRSALHLFSVGGDTLESAYLGSQYVPGVPHSQFSFDIRDDVLRVATTQSGVFADGDAFTTRNQIVTLRMESDALAMVGTTGGLAPGERIFAVRYVGDRGYMVTFRRVDPLFVIDLSDSSSPRLLGELHIPGFSEYMHPLGENHLLTIGQDADDEGRVRGLALRIFDVSDDSNPTLAHFHAFSGQGWSVANSDHHAFTFDSGRGLLAFPYVSYDGDFRSSLELFSVDSETGFGLLGEVDHTELTAEQCGLLEEWQCAYSPEVRRGLFIEDFLYSISGAGVLVHAADDLKTERARVVLPAASLAQPEGPIPFAVP